MPTDTHCTRDTSDTFLTYPLICAYVLNEWSLKSTWKTIIKTLTQNKTSRTVLHNKKSRERKNVLHKTNYSFSLKGVSSYRNACQQKNFLSNRYRPPKLLLWRSEKVLEMHFPAIWIPNNYTKHFPSVPTIETTNLSNLPLH